MEQYYKELWETAREDLEKISGLLDQGEEQLRRRQQKLQEKIKDLRQGLQEVEPENRWLLLQDIENQKQRLQDLQEQIRIYQEKLGSPYFSQIVPEAGYYQDGLFISKYISDVENNVLKYTAPLAALRYKDIGASEIINGIEYQLEKKQFHSIEERVLQELKHFDRQGTVVCTAGQFQRQKPEDTPRDLQVKKENLKKVEVPAAQEEQKYVLGEIIAQMRKEQDLIMRAPHQGVTLIKGAAGSGKTNIAFHRIVYLVSEHPQQFRQDRIAVFCYNVALKKYLSNMLQELDIPRVSVFSLDRWFYNLLRDLTNIGWLNYQEDERSKYLKTRMDILPVLQDFLKQYKRDLQQSVQTVTKDRGSLYLIDAYSILNQLYQYQPFLDYLGEDRRYPGGRYEAKSEVDSSDQYLLTYLIYHITSEMEPACFPQFDHIVVDEVQDVTPVQMEIIHQLHRHSMTLVGDVTQRIFPTGVDSWNQFNIHIDQVYELEMCHRSTLQTICFANELLIQEGDRVLSTSVGKQGEKPLVYVLPSRLEAINQAVRTLNQIKDQNPQHSVVVVNYRKSDLTRIQEALERENLDSYIASKMNWNFSPRVAVTTYHQIKGLEFDYVLVLGLNEYEKTGADKKEQVIYTVTTRAQKQVFFFCTQELPSMLKGIDPDLFQLL